MSTVLIEEQKTYVEVMDSDETTTVEITEEVVSIVEVGTQGPEGIAGVGADKNYSYDFINTSTFTVTHGLYKYPSVTVVDSAGDEVEGDVKYLDLNNVTVAFSAPFSGKAFFN